VEINLTLTESQKAKMKTILASQAPYIIFPAGRRFGKTEFAVRWQCPKIFANPTTPDSPHGWVSPILPYV